MKCLFLILTYFLSLSSSAMESYINAAPVLPKDGVYLTLDLCGGKTNQAVLDVLWTSKTQTSLFVTTRWLKQNPATVTWLKDKQTVFHIENHGFEHLQPLLSKPPMYGLKAASSNDEILKEIDYSAAYIQQLFGTAPTWYRPAGALTDKEALDFMTAKQVKIAGFHVNGDWGATASSDTVLKQLKNAKPGEVILLHANHPESHNAKAVQEWVNQLQSQKVLALPTVKH